MYHIYIFFFYHVCSYNSLTLLYTILYSLHQNFLGLWRYFENLWNKLISSILPYMNNIHCIYVHVYLYMLIFLAEIFSNTCFLGPKKLFTCFFCVCNLYWAAADRNQQWTCGMLSNISSSMIAIQLRSVFQCFSTTLPCPCI